MWRLDRLSQIHGRRLAQRFLVVKRNNVYCFEVTSLLKRSTHQQRHSAMSTAIINGFEEKSYPDVVVPRKEAMQTIVDSLLNKTTAVVPVDTSHSTEPIGSNIIQPEYTSDVLDPSPAAGTTDAVTEAMQLDLKAEKVQKASSSIPLHPAVARVSKFVHVGSASRAFDAFYELVYVVDEAKAKNEPPPRIPSSIIKDLFQIACTKYPFDAYRILQFYTQLPGTSEYKKGNGDLSAYKNMYERACNTIRRLDPNRFADIDCRELIRSIMSDVRRMDRPSQEMCLPVLLSALVMQRGTMIGNLFAPPLYKYITEEDFSLPPGYWIHLLSLSRYNRQDDIPYEDVLERAIATGRLIAPSLILNVLDNIFPYSDMKKTKRMLDAILQLQHAVVNNNLPSSDQYFVDIERLEMIGATAACQGHSDVNLLIWDMIDVLQYEPTEAIYENTIVSFVMNPFTYREAFSVMGDMEKAGFIPSRALIRSISAHLRDTTKNLDYAVEQLKELSYEGRPITVSSLNTLMSAAAERGDIDRVLQFLQQFERSGIVPNSDTYSFAFESLGKNVRKGRRRNPVSKDHKEACLVAAESFLAKMDEQGIAPTHHIIREYVEMLCLLGEVDTATIILKEAATENGLVTSKSIYRVAMANAKVLHRFDIAREIAQLDGGVTLPWLLDSIDREERFYTQGLGSREYEPVLSDNSAPVNEPEQIDNAYDEWDHGVNGNGFQNAINGEPEVEFVQADPIAPYPNQERTS